MCALCYLERLSAASFASRYKGNKRTEVKLGDDLHKFFQALEMIMKGTPPREVPDGLGAHEYYELGKHYKLAGWIAQSKKSLKKAIILDPDDVGKKAQIYLNAYLPRNDIPEEAVTANIHAVNKSLLDEAGAEKAYLELMKEYPHFEWPYGNLGMQYVKNGKLEEAKKVLNDALEVNPHYTNALIHLAAAYEKEENNEESDKFLNRVLEADPDFDSNILTNYPKLEKRLKELSKSR